MPIRRARHRRGHLRTSTALLIISIIAPLAPGQDTIQPVPPVAEKKPGTLPDPRRKELPPGLSRSPYADIQREVQAVRVTRGPKVDGRLDDEVWKQAPAGGPLVQVLPHEGAETTQRTDVRFLYDDDNLYIGVWCFDDDPDGIIAIEMAHDGRIYADDFIDLVLDTFLDRRNGYMFRVNPNGAKGEALISDNVSLNESWDCVWSAACAIDAEGWKAEIAIPFKSLGFNPDTEVWGFNMFRQIRRNSEKDRWTHLGFLRARIGFSPDLNWYHVFQYDSVSDTFGYNSRIAWEFRPGAWSYLVLNQTFARDHSSMDLVDSELTLKIEVIFRF